MKRWLMILLFAAGGLATEIAHPVQCSLLAISRQQVGNRRGRNDGQDGTYKRGRAPRVLHPVDRKR
ncbi:hypothetical protein [Burkholderia ambifaria]|nr:hypothetical protein [Burkholderia ambifaria]